MRTLIVVLFVVLSPAIAICAPCTGDGPECVLRCMENAYATRDLQGFSDLLADDYEYFFGDNPESWGRDEEVKVHVEMFDPDSVSSLKLTIFEGYVVHEGSDTDTWVLDGVRAQVEMDFFSDGKVHHAKGQPDSCVLHIRRVDKPESHYQIYRWWSAGQ